MAKSKSGIKKLNFNKVRKYLNYVSLTIVVFISVLLAFIFIAGYSQIKNKNLTLLKEKKEKIYEAYIAEVFQRILLLSYSTPFLNYLHAGEMSRNNLEVDLLKNFNPYVSKEIIGYKLLDNKKNNLSAVGKESDTFLLLELCYLNNLINPVIGRCKAFLYVYFNYKSVLDKISQIDPDWTFCEKCFEFRIKDGTILNGIRIVKNTNFFIPYSIKNDRYQQLLFFILICIAFIVSIILVVFYINHLILEKYIITPVKNLFAYVQNEKVKEPLVLEEISMVAEMIDELKEKIKFTEREKQQAEFVKLAQVAHDIRSPLAASNVFLSLTSELPEDKRVLARNAIFRIQDIANNLVKKQQHLFQSNGHADIEEAKTIQFISNLIDVLISEKRLQFKDKHNIVIEFKADKNSYGIFSCIQPNEFKRMLSNLINNSVEAIEDKGCISLFLSTQADNFILKLTDTGKGIPAHIIPRLMNAGATFNKKNGTGLGLAHAYLLVQNWGGQFTIDSKENIGTTVTVSLPTAKEPPWFLPKLCLTTHSTIVVIDDDASIHDIWEERFKSFKKTNSSLNIIHFSNPKDLIAWHAIQNTKSFQQLYYLCDYEFMNYSENGLELIVKLNIASQAVVVSSRFEDVEIQSACEKSGVKLLPKSLVCLLPISIVTPLELNHSKNCIQNDSYKNVHAILIDDDLFMHQLWQMTAPDKIVMCFEHPKMFFDRISEFNKDIQIYIDSNLSGTLKGEEVAREIYRQGFRNIYLATGYSPNYFPKMEWIKEIRDKTPPWMH